MSRPSSPLRPHFIMGLGESPEVKPRDNVSMRIRNSRMEIMFLHLPRSHQLGWEQQGWWACSRIAPLALLRLALFDERHYQRRSRLGSRLPPHRTKIIALKKPQVTISPGQSASRLLHLWAGSNGGHQIAPSLLNFRLRTIYNVLSNRRAKSHRFLAQILDRLDRYKIRLDLITTSE